MDQQKHVTVEVNGNKLVNQLFVLLIACILFCIAIDFLFNYQKNYPDALREFCNMGREDSFSSWYSSFLLLLTAGALWLIVIIKKQKIANPFNFIGWVSLALFFTFLAIDDAAQIHESIGSGVSEYFRANPEQKESSPIQWLLDFYPSYNWQILVLPFFICMGIFLLFFLWKEFYTWNLKLSIILALTCFSFAVGLDFVEGRTSWHEGIADKLDLSPKALRHHIRLLEESLEMSGAAIFFRTFFMHFTKICDVLSISFLERKTTHF